jgi:uncharacterized protein (TIGR02453 family)
MLHPVITKEIFQFLNKLKEHNNREWFMENKNEFVKHQSAVKAFFNAIMGNLNKHDQIEKMKMFRIYRDVRFSKDKTPYKTHFAGSFSRMGAERRGGYYIRIKPGETFLATGFFNPNKEDLFRIRKELEIDASEFRDIFNVASFKSTWGALEGEAVKTAPKGFDKEHPDIDLIRHKQFIFTKKITNEEALSQDFLAQIDNSFKAIRPFFDLMSSVLTTNLNGESLIR